MVKLDCIILNKYSASPGYKTILLDKCKNVEKLSCKL